MSDTRRYEPTPTTDDSGLRDLRALLARHARPSGAERASEPELLAAPSWAPPAPVAPALPAPRARRTGAAALVAASMMAVSMVALAAVPALDRRAAPTASAPKPAPVAVSVDPEPVEVSPEPLEEAAPPDEAPAPAATIRPRPSPARADASRRGAVPPAVRHQPPRPSTAPAPATAPADVDPELDAIVDAALRGARPDPTPEALPATPGAREVMAELRSLEREVATCREGSSAIVPTRVLIDGATGRVRRVEVTSDDAAARACVAGIVDDATFPRFAQDQFAVSFAYRL